MLKHHRTLIKFFLLAHLLTATALKAQQNQPASFEKTILITGGAGFIGRNFLSFMFDKYPRYQFLVLDALTYAGSLDNIPEAIKSSNRFKFFYGSITNQKLVNLLMSQSDFVVHFAAESHVTRSIHDPAIFFETDIIGTRVLMDGLVTHAKKIKCFIHISTSEVCGTAERVPMDEEHPIKPRSPYAAAKAGADRLVYAYQCTYDIPSVIIRPFNNYGPCQHLEKMIPRFITSALKGEKINIHGDGSQTRDWLHTTDTCRALDKVLHHPNFSLIKNEVIHIGSGKETSVSTIAECICKHFNLPKSAVAYVADRPGQVMCHHSSTEKAKRLLDWEPTISLEEGLSQVIAWYYSHQEWWQKRELLREVPIYVGENRIEMQ